MADLAQELRILEALVAFDTTSRNSNLELIDWVEALARGHGCVVERIPGADGSKANLLLGVGPRVPGGLVLSGHTDVVPVDGQPWTTDPWRLTERDGRLFGRGTADMKGFIALALAAIGRVDARRLRRPLFVALSFDEEIGCLGAPELIAAMQERVPSPATVIVGEPTSLEVVVAHKGIRLYDVSVRGKEAHSSSAGLGIGTSAIAAATELLALIHALHAEAAQDPPPVSLFRPPGTTLTVGRIEGGTAANILARDCRFTWDLRAESEAEADRQEARVMAAVAELDARLQRFDPGCGVTMVRRAAVPPLESDPDSPARVLAQRHAGDPRACGCVSFVAEAGLFTRAGFPAVLCGPGSIDQAHQPDEWISLEQLVAGRAFVERLVGSLQS